MKEIIHEDAAFGLTDRNKFVGFVQANSFHMNISIGDEIPSGDPLYQLFDSGKAFMAVIPKEVFGVHILGGGFPLRDEMNRVIGAVTIAKNLDRQLNLEQASENMASSLQQTSASIEEIAAGSQKLANTIEEIIKITEINNQKIKETDNIVSLIQSISTQSNLLALNAAIEAARAGASGRGFSVVAEEMRKLAQISSESTQKVSKILSEMRIAEEDLAKHIQNLSIAGHTQAAATEEITASLQEIVSSSDLLVQLSKREYRS
ncbi:methyl-accepting chemotaxis protein [Dehalobacter sp. DCM]|uniref:methyl-accepting chemotaxis protein n=1 Tax=Dehalobacter sp. DCM TaxID=2907827 RepID=UPI003081D1D7|nr:methyl-accepting chemotaxis protein [Dehalobacter sp. DCM]